MCVCCRRPPREKKKNRHSHLNDRKLTATTQIFQVSLSLSLQSVRSCRTSSWSAAEPSPSSGRPERTPRSGGERLPLALRGVRKRHRCSAASSAPPCSTRTLFEKKTKNTLLRHNSGKKKRHLKKKMGAAQVQFDVHKCTGAESGASPSKQLLIHSTVMALKRRLALQKLGDYCSTISAVVFAERPRFFCST